MHPNRLCRAAASLLAMAPLSLCGQAAAPASSSVTLPLPGIHYRYWPEQFVQWVGPELPYSMIVLDVDNRGKQPIYDAELIPKSGGAPVRYTNSAEELAIDQKSGLAAHQVAMKFDGPPDPENGAQYMLRFATETGTPVVWQFVLGSDVSEQGSGLSPVPAPIPVLMYRTLGGLAGQGTALQVGGVTSVAAEWTEIARPPYFVPYRGAVSTGVQILTFVPGASDWKADGPTLSDAAGASLQVSQQGGVVTMTNAALGTTIAYDGGTAGMDRVTFGPEHAKRDDTVTIQFSPALTPGAQSHFEVIAGKKTKIAAGTVEAAKAGTGESANWSFTAPDDLRGKGAQATARLQP